MTETVAEALSRHEADCPVCQSGYAPHCHDREDVEELAELRVALAAAEAERDRYLTRACVAESRARWVPVAELLPDASQQVLGWNGKVMQSSRLYAGQWLTALGTLVGVTHWMPLPKPPKENP